MPFKPSKQQQNFFYAAKGFCSQVDCTDWPRMTNQKTLPKKMTAMKTRTMGNQLPKIELPKVRQPKVNPLRIPKLSFGGKRGRFDGSSNSDYYTKIFR